MTPDKILIIEDEQNLVEALRYNLEREGHQVVHAYDGLSGLESAKETTPDLVILDIMLPGLDGFELCRLLRRDTDVPILVLTAKGEEIDRVVGLELGADDYVTKPFSMRELQARIRNLLRRAHSAPGPVDSKPGRSVTAGDLELDLEAHSVTLRGQTLELRRREFDLLVMLASNRGRAFTREQILDRVWGADFIGEARTVDVHVRWLREKIQSYPGAPQRIITIRGVGYRFEA